MTQKCFNFLTVLIPFLFSTTFGFSQADSIQAITDVSIINEESQVATEILKKIESQISGVEVAEYQVKSDKLNDTIQLFLHRHFSNLSSEISFRNLEIRQRELKLMEEEIAAFLEDINSEARIYSLNLATLTREEQKWEKTNAYLKSMELSELSDLAINIESLVLKTHETRKALLRQYNKVLKVQNQQNALKLEVQHMAEEVNFILVNYRSELFKLDSPPIWKTSIDARKIKREFKSDLKSLFRVSLVYLKNNTNLTGQLFFFFLVLYLTFYLLKRHYLKVLPAFKQDGPIGLPENTLQRLKIFTRPFSLALMISLMIVYYSESMPIEITELVILILVVPILLILHQRVTTQYFRYIVYIFILFVVQNTSGIFFYTSQLSRYINFLTGIVFIALLFYIYKNILGKISRESFPYKRLVGIISLAMMAMFFIATISNAFGNVFLADSVFFAAMTSIYGGFVYFICFLVISQIIVLFSSTIAAKGASTFIRTREKLTAQVNRLVFFVFFLIWFDLVLRMYSIDEFVYGIFSQVFNFSFNIGDFEIVPSNLAVLVFVIWVTFKFSSFIKEFLENDILSSMSLASGLPGTISMLTRYSILVVGFFIAVVAAGIELDNLTIIIGGLGVGIGFGLQNIINNFISGLILAFERPIKIGDVIQMEELLGTVKEIGIRSSTVRSLDGAEVIVPNGNLISNELINWTLSDKYRRLDLRIGVAYGTDPQKVLDILKKVMSNHEKIIDNPIPSALFIGFGDSSLDFRLLFWTDDFDNRLILESDINVRINNSLKEAGIEIPFPQRDLHLRSVDKGIDFSNKKTKEKKE